MRAMCRRIHVNQMYRQKEVNIYLLLCVILHLIWIFPYISDGVRKRGRNSYTSIIDSINKKADEIMERMDALEERSFERYRLLEQELRREQQIESDRRMDNFLQGINNIFQNYAANTSSNLSTLPQSMDTNNDQAHVLISEENEENEYYEEVSYLD